MEICTWCSSCICIKVIVLTSLAVSQSLKPVLDEHAQERLFCLVSLLLLVSICVLLVSRFSGTNTINCNPFMHDACMKGLHSSLRQSVINNESRRWWSSCTFVSFFTRDSASYSHVKSHELINFLLPMVVCFRFELCRVLELELHIEPNCERPLYVEYFWLLLSFTSTELCIYTN